MLNTDAIGDYLHLRRPEAETLAWLAELTPEKATPPLLSALIETIRETALPIAFETQGVMDCCGTGGSGQSHYNTSTAVAFVLAAANVPVVKFGNRAITSASGSFDLLQRLGFPAELPEACLTHNLDVFLADAGVVFLYAPQCYPALAPFNALRRRLGTRTLFNVIGPLLNPVSPAYRLLGVSDAHIQPAMAQYLASEAYTRKAWVVRAASGLDDVAIEGDTVIYHVENKGVLQRTYSPISQMLNPAAAGILTPEINATLFEALLAGGLQDTDYHWLVCLNAGAALTIAGQAPDIDTGAALAEALLAEGAVAEAVARCRRAYAKHAG